MRARLQRSDCMAERRMFAKSIVLSDAFLDMPLGARCLYMTMGMVADDDGFVNNAKSIIRITGASDDDLRVLVAKKFVLPFEDGVLVIKHWRINNYLRSDRYQATKYTENKEKLLIDNNGAYTMNDFGIPSSGIPSIGKDSIGKDSIDNNISSSVSSDNRKEDITTIVDKWNDLKDIGIKSISKLKPGTDRYKRLCQRIDDYGLEEVLRAIDNIKDSKFLQTWQGFTFDWFVRPNNFIKVLDGNYTGGKDGSGRNGEQDKSDQEEYKWSDYYPDIPLSEV